MTAGTKCHPMNNTILQTTAKLTAYLADQKLLKQTKTKQKWNKDNQKASE